MFLRRSFPKTAIYRGICLGNTTSEKFMVSVQNLEERLKFSSFSFSLKLILIIFQFFIGSLKMLL